MSKTVSSSRAKGDYYYRKTVKWFQNQGYTVAKLEQSKMAKIRGRFIVIRSDTWGSDGMALSPKKLVFFQVKFNAEKKGGAYYRSQKFYQEMKTPNNVERWLIDWRPRKASPNVEIFL